MVWSVPATKERPMRSAYGFKVPAEDSTLTHVTPGSPMGEVLRRYWQPIALAEDLTDLPRRLKVMGEDLVAFRDKSGKVGVLHLHCAHRGTSLEYGRVEQDGIRCCYHGWKYRADGKCIEMPCEQPGYAERMDVWQPSYPVHEFGGLVFVYMGPPEKQPLFPMYDIIDTSKRKDVVIRGMRIWGDCAIGYVRDCNWLQHTENVVDPYHLLMLHQMISGDQFNGALMRGTPPEIGFEKTSLGVRYRFVRDLPNGNHLVRYVESVVPNIMLIANIHEKGEQLVEQDRASEITWVLPIDNEHVCAYSLVAWPLKDGKPDPDWRPRTDTVIPQRPGWARDRSYEDRQRKPDDMEAQEGQRPIAVHALENLALSDTGVAMLRKLLREQVTRVQRGEDPMNIVRDPARNVAIPTNAWNTVRPQTRQAAE
jgi:nitrite reductase/ring-hydroxylating ferredoxin subunit